MKKRVGVIALCIIVGVMILVVLAEQFRAWTDYRSALEFPAAEQAEVEVRSYQTGQSRTLTEAETQVLLEQLREQARFDGIGSQSVITAKDHAYSVSIAASDYYHIFIVAEQDGQNWLYGDSFVIQLKELPEVVALLDGYFD